MGAISQGSLLLRRRLARVILRLGVGAKVPTASEARIGWMSFSKAGHTSEYLFKNQGGGSRATDRALPAQRPGQGAVLGAEHRAVAESRPLGRDSRSPRPRD